MKILAELSIPSGGVSAAVHTVNAEQLGPTFKLRIVQFSGEYGFYLIRYSSGGQELTDTLHDSVQDALVQAEFEYGVSPNLWLRLT